MTTGINQSFPKKLVPLGDGAFRFAWDYGVRQATLATMNDYTNRGYTDQEQLDNVALVDMNGRVYDPTVGRMISADPTVPAPLFSQAFNRYSYVYNSPLKYVDPSGFTSCPPDLHHCPTSADGGDSGTNTETGSHIPGVDTGASCSGNCAGWTDFGPGPNGPGNGAEGSGPCEGGPGNCGLGSAGGGENADPANNANTAQLGAIQVNGHRLPTPPQQPYFENNWQFDQSMLQIGLLQGLTPMGRQANGDPAAVLNNLKKHGSVDFSIKAGILALSGQITLSFTTTGVALTEIWAPAITPSLDISAGGSESWLNSPSGFYSGLDVSGGDIIGGDLFIGAGDQSGIIFDTGLQFNAGFSAQIPLAYRTQSFSYSQFISFMNTMGHYFSTNPLIVGGGP